MSNYKIRFQYNQEDIIILYQRNELMKDIIKRYGEKSGLAVDEFYFLYNGDKINPELTLNQVNDNDAEILIIVYSKKNQENKDKNFNYLKCNECSDLTQIKKITESCNEITLKIKIEESDINNTIYFLDNTQENDYGGNLYWENGNWVNHNHDNLTEMNESNTILIINEKIFPYKKHFIPTKNGIYSIKLLFKNKLSDCSYMFCHCKNIIDIDFSKFNTENVTDMQHMFHDCFELKSLNLKSFKTEKVKNMNHMFCSCSSLTSLDLKSFNTLNVTNMACMFGGMFNEAGCSSLITLDLSSFNTQNVNNMQCMFVNCSSLTTLNLSSFNMNKVTDMGWIFDGCCSLTKVNLSSFNAAKANTCWMFKGCINLFSCVSADKNIIDAFTKKEKSLIGDFAINIA